MNRIIVLGALLYAASPSFAHRVRVDFDHSARFSCYRTYRWAESADAPSAETLFPNQILRTRIAGFVEEALAARGLKRVATGGDLLISFNIEITDQPQFTTFYDGGPGWGWGGGIATTTVQNIPEGTLILNMMDSNRNRLVFQGASTHIVSSRPERNTRTFAKAVNEIFGKYPPQP